MLRALIWLLGCEEAPSSIHLYRAGLESGDCGPIPDPWLRDDCYLATASKKSIRTNPCDPIVAQELKNECWFVMAEIEKDPALCRKADRFSEDCALHVLSGTLTGLVPKEAMPGDMAVEAAWEEQIQKSGMLVSDPRPWSAFYRWVLGQHHPLDRASCSRITEGMRKEACEKTGEALYNDLLNHARDRRLYPCDKVAAGEPPGSLKSNELPVLLQHTPDPELDALRLSRTDLCLL
jgi:hypothetical protein